MAYQIDFFKDAAPVEGTFKAAAARFYQRLNDRLNVALNREIGSVIRDHADKQDFDGIRFLLSRHPVRVSTQDSDAPLIDFFKGETPIEEAFQTVAKDINQRLNDKLKATITQEIGGMICDCADKRDFDGIRYLISEHPEQINARDSENDTSLIVAVNQGSEKITDFLLAQSNVDINAKGNEEMTALMWACDQNYTDIGRTLLQRPDIDITVKDEDGDTALILAVQSENSELVRLLLEREGADVEDKDEEGGSARSIAEAFKGDTFDQTEILALIKGHKSYGVTPTAGASKAAADEGEDGADSQQYSDIKSKTLRRYAVRYPYPHSLAFLRWADSQNFEDIRHATKKITHNRKPLMTPDLRAFVMNPDAMYKGEKRNSYDPMAASICKHIGYDPSADYPLVSAELGSEQKPPDAAP